MQIENNISLKPRNTFGVDVKAKYFVEVYNINELKELLSDEKYSGVKKIILGGGSNVLFTKDFEGLVIVLSNKDIKVISQNYESFFIEADAGVEWDEFVKYCVDNNYTGLENLSLIPGKVGAAPIQNIGAYGVEVKDFIEKVNIILLDNLEIKTLSNSECKFGYRDSAFKQSLKGMFIITSVLFRIPKNPIFNIGYEAIKNYFKNNEISKINSESIRNAIISIRRSKLPDPNEIGNAGSFFKNPIISKLKYGVLKNEYPELNGYFESENAVKISAGWLIEKCGLKGKRTGDVGVHDKQALVLVNYGSATGTEIVEFSKMIQQEVKNKFDINIFNEVNII